MDKCYNTTCEWYSEMCLENCHVSEIHDTAVSGKYTIKENGNRCYYTRGTLKTAIAKECPKYMPEVNKQQKVVKMYTQDLIEIIKLTIDEATHLRCDVCELLPNDKCNIVTIFNKDIITNPELKEAVIGPIKMEKRNAKDRDFINHCFINRLKNKGITITIKPF